VTWRITRSGMFAPLLEVYPAFRPTHDAFLAKWAHELEKPNYLLLGDLADSLIADLAAGRTGHFAAVFDVVERWIRIGDMYVSEAAVIGLLEDLQNTNLHKAGTAPEQFVPWLGEEARKGWNDLNAFWGMSYSPGGGATP
jgi:hypothetical protein